MKKRAFVSHSLFRGMLLAAGALICSAAHAEEVAPIAPPQTEPVQAAPTSSVSDARLSLSVEGAPMAQVFSLVEAMTQLRARYAAPPDALLTARFEEESLTTALDKMLGGTNWTTQRDESSLFLRTKKNTTWQVWTGKEPPGARWSLPPGAREYLLPAVSLTTAPGSPSRLTSRVEKAPRERLLTPKEKAARALEESLWKDVPLHFDAWRTPGIVVEADSSIAIVATKAGKGASVTGAAPASTRAAWMRCDVTLRVVPAGLRFSIATPAQTTLFVNGAPVLSGRSGQSQVDVSRVLRPGINRLALQWKDVPQETASPQPLLRYEWHLIGGP